MLPQAPLACPDGPQETSPAAGIREWAARIAAQAPPLTPEQIATCRAIFAGARPVAAAAA